MSYTDIDLIDKAISIANRQKEIYLKINEDKCNSPSMKIFLKVIIKEMDKAIEYYKTLKKEFSCKICEEISFLVYDKISFLINEFSRNISEPPTSNVKNFLESFLDLQKDTNALFIDIQGRFVKHTSDTHTETYKILSDIINNKANLIKMLENFIK